MNNSMVDIDSNETQEWLESLYGVIARQGPDRARWLLDQLDGRAQALGVQRSSVRNTPYYNTIPVESQPIYPGDLSLEARIEAAIRWNAIALVVRAQETGLELGGHIGAFASSSTLYDVGFNHFWRAPTADRLGDLIFFQGHISPGIYARSYLMGNLNDTQMQNFRQETKGRGLGLSSYPHPWLMPDYWQFPTVSMGLGPMQAIYQARYMKYLQARGLLSAEHPRHVWCFCGDGEMDEPESTGALSIAAREQLDNLIFVINCNLQRLDGPVRGNGKIIQELESTFFGAGWHVLKVVWGSGWDSLLAADHSGKLAQRMQEVVDGEYQNCKAKGGAYTREHFFGAYPETAALVKDYSDEQIAGLHRGGHDPRKVYAAYAKAVAHKGQPTVILAKTVKGFGLGQSGEAQNIAHNVKKLDHEGLKHVRDRFNLPISDEQLDTVPFFRFAEKSPEAIYLQERRATLGGHLPQRRRKADHTVPVPELSAFQALLSGSNDRSFSTTMAFVRIINILSKLPELGPRLVPIVPDEARTFGMEGLFRQLGIYAPLGQKYRPVDADQVMFYKESADGQILQEGINEAGAFCSWMAAGTAYSVHNTVTIPFYIYYSMFGFQRIGDFAWAAADMRTRGFLIGATAGRTTLNGEGLQHQDGHSHVMAGTIPNCVSYDPSYAYELVVIIQNGLKRMIAEQEDVYYYITVMNENYTHPDMPEGAESGILSGLYLLKTVGETKATAHVRLLGSGTILHEVEAAAELLWADFNIASDVFSATSFNELAREAHQLERLQQMGQIGTDVAPYVTRCLSQGKGPVIAATDYIRSYVDQIRAWVPAPYHVLGTDGFGRSDGRAALREHFEVDRNYVAYQALWALVQDKQLPESVLEKARTQYALDATKSNPLVS